MIKCAITVKELLQRTIIVEEENIEEAIKKVEKAVKSGEIILDADDFNSREIVAFEY